MSKIFILLLFVFSSIKAQNLSISNGRILTIVKSGSVTMTGDFSNNNGKVILNSDSNEFSSIIVKGSSVGNIIYNRYVNIVGDDAWDLIGSAVSGLSINSFITDAYNTEALATNGNYFAVSSYNNVLSAWEHSTLETSGNLNIGQGYQMATDSGATLVFTGTITTTDIRLAIQNTNAANPDTGSRWNLVANPYPSYINGNNDTDINNNFLTVNSSVLDDSFEAIYGYNADGSGYTAYNHSYNLNDTPVYIAPGQAFFIAAANENVGDSIHFSTAMRTIIGGDDFITSRIENTSYLLVLEIHNINNSLIDETKFYFKEGLTLGLDPGYDAGAFNQAAAINSRLVEEDQGINFTINAMGVVHMSNTTIPLVLNQEEGQTFKVSIASSSLFEDINVYLEDTLLGEMTLLQEQDFELTTQNEITGAGRFFIHLTTTTLSNEDSLTRTAIRVYKGKGNDFITIKGLLDITTTAKLFNVLGQVVRTKVLRTSNETISTNGLNSGTYLIQLRSKKSLLTKKIYIE